MMKTVFLASVASVVMIGAAQAADVEAPAVYDWTGPYIGLQGGYGWGDNDVTAKANATEALAALVDSNPVTVNQGKGSIGVDGFIGGLHAGYNWQSDSLVLGLEGDIEYADMDGSTRVLEDGDRAGKIKEQFDWLGSLRLRAGFAADRALFYATGGLAVGGVELSLYDNDGKFADNDDTKWGWTLGGGVEYAFTDELSARIEYRYTDLGSISAGDADEGGRGKADVDFHAVRAGLTWHFNGL